MTAGKPRTVLLALTSLVLVSSPAQALVGVRIGSSPVEDRNWRAGAVDVANLKSRILYWEGPPFGGGMLHFLYRGDTEAFNEALRTFAKVRAPSLQLIVRDGPGEAWVLKGAKKSGADSRYDWEFVIWDVRSYYRLFGDPTSEFMARVPDFRRPLPPPRMEVFISRGGAIAWEKVQLPEGITVIDRRASAAGIRPEQGAVITGNVYDMATAKPLAGATVAVQRKENGDYRTVVTAQADADGHFMLERVQPGEYRVRVSAKGYAPLVAGYYERLVPNGHLAFDDVQLASLATITGSVLDGDGQPIAGVSVQLWGTLGISGLRYRLPKPAKTTTDARGRFEITGVPMGYGQVHCSAAGRRAPMGELRSVPAKGLVFRMSDTGAIKGNVIGKTKKGRSINVHVKPEGGYQAGTWGGATKVKPDGTFQFDNVPPGTYVILAGHLAPGTAPGPKAKKVTVVAGQTVTVQLEP